MYSKFFTIDKEKCSQLAYSIFMDISGCSREGRKYEKMRRDALKMRQSLDDKIEIRASYNYYDASELQLKGKKLLAGGKTFSCQAFEMIKPETVTGVFFYALSIGDTWFDQESTLNNLYADIWGTAFADAARVLLKEELSAETRLSDSFGPGFYGMKVTQMADLAQVVDFEKLDMELRNSLVIVPLKSCAGMVFSVTDDYRELNRACADCRGNHTSCKLCHVNGGDN